MDDPYLVEFHDAALKSLGTCAKALAYGYRENPEFVEWMCEQADPKGILIEIIRAMAAQQGIL